MSTQINQQSKYMSFCAARNVIQELKRTVKGDNPFQVPLLDESFALDYVNDYQVLRATFRRTEDNRIVLRTYNWQAENEICCVVSLEQAREIYKKLQSEGFERL